MLSPGAQLFRTRNEGTPNGSRLAWSRSPIPRWTPTLSRSPIPLWSCTCTPSSTTCNELSAEREASLLDVRLGHENKLIQIIFYSFFFRPVLFHCRGRQSFADGQRHLEWGPSMEAGVCAGEVIAGQVIAGLPDSILPSECWVHIFSFLRGSELARFASHPASPNPLAPQRSKANTINQNIILFNRSKFNIYKIKLQINKIDKQQGGGGVQGVASAVGPTLPMARPVRALSLSVPLARPCRLSLP